MKNIKSWEIFLESNIKYQHQIKKNYMDDIKDGISKNSDIPKITIQDDIELSFVGYNIKDDISTWDGRRTDIGFMKSINLDRDENNKRQIPDDRLLVKLFFYSKSNNTQYCLIFDNLLQIYLINHKNVIQTNLNMNIDDVNVIINLIKKYFDDVTKFSSNKYDEDIIHFHDIHINGARLNDKDIYMVYKNLILNNSSDKLMKL